MDAVPNESGARAAGSPPFNLQLSTGASPQQIVVNDDDTAFNEIGDPGQVLTNAITIDGVTYPAGSRVVINYVLTTDDGFEGYSITLGTNNTGSNTTTAFITNTPMVPGQTYVFTSEGNIGNSNAYPYAQFACFTAGTPIITPDGPRAVEAIRAGDLVETRDNGPLPVRWAGQRLVPGVGRLAPIVFRKGVFGASADLVVSPQHRMLVTGAAAQLCFGEEEVLVPAKAFVNGDSVLRCPVGMVTYAHLMLDDHHLLQAHGVWSESLFAGDQTMLGLDAAQHREITAIFPELAGGSAVSLARPGIRPREGRVLARLAGVI